MDDIEISGNLTDEVPRDALNGGRSEPIAPSFPAVAKVEIGPVSAKTGKIFAADIAQGRDALGLESALWPLAELAAHRDSEAPFTIGLLGAAGSGKSFALGKLLAAINALSEAAVVNGGRGPFLSRIFSLRVDASSIDGAPEVALAAALYDKLGAVFPEFVREATHAVRDPRIVAREAAERLDDGRRRLDAERQNLDEIESRRARLGETVLFESAGSQVDAYARANRAKIESRLQSFGLAGDTITNYKSMVRDIAESGGPTGRIGAALRAFWAFKGQTQLLVVAALLILAGLGLDAAFADRESWLGTLRNASSGLASVANWAEAHIGWLTLAAKTAFAGAALALIANVLRGVSFLNPLFRGVSLLQSDVANRRQALDALYAHQTRRVDGMEADVELASRHAVEADRRAGPSTTAQHQADPSPFGDSTLKAQAERFFSALSASMEGVRHASAGAPRTGLASAPSRLIVALDNVDELPQPNGRALLDAAHRAFSKNGFVTLIAADTSRLDGGDGIALEKCIQVPFRVGEAAGRTADYAAFVEHVIGRASLASNGVATKLSPQQHLDWSISADESALLAGVAPLVGNSPRAIKRLVNLYRIARSQTPAQKGALALILALDLGGTDDDIAAVRRALAREDVDTDLRLEGSSRLAAALTAAQKADGWIGVRAARNAAVVARTFSLRA